MNDDVSAAVADVGLTPEESRNERAMAVVRLVAALVTVLNFVLVSLGWDPFQLDNDLVYVLVAAVLDLAASFWNWWRNNNVTVASQIGQRVTDTIKAKHMMEV